MGLTRMFQYNCDSRITGYDCIDDTGSEWYASMAKEGALKDGWHINAKYAICPVCWEAGARFKDLS